MALHRRWPAPTSIDAFLDALWIEDGLAANSLAAYRRDLTLLARWLEVARHRVDRRGAARPTCSSYAVARHAASAATSANRRLTVFRRFFRWAVRERLAEVDPTLRRSRRRASRCACPRA